MTQTNATSAGEVRILPRADVEAHSRALYKAGAAKAPLKPIVGALEIARLMDVREFVFRMKMYRVPPIEADLAAQILDCQDRLQRHTKPGTTVEEIRDLFYDAARLSKLAARPTGLVRRVLWLWPRYNPFRMATPVEVGRHLSFFCTLIVYEAVLPNAEPFAHGLGTFNPTSRASPSGSRPGATPPGGRSNGGAGSRSRGPTSSSASRGSRTMTTPRS